MATRPRQDDRDILYRTIIQTSMDGFWVVDAEGRLLDVNEAYGRMSGYTVEELLTLRISDLDAHESDHDAAAHNQRIREQRGDRFETRHRRKDGTLFDVEVSAQYLPDGGGRFVGFLRDITARKRAESVIRESEERFRSLSEQALSAVATHELVLNDAGQPADYVFLSANAAFEALTGLRVADIVGRRVTEVIPGIGATGLIERYGRVALTGEPEVFERYVEPLRRHYLVHAYRIGDRRFATGFVDLTDRKHAEDALRESEARLARALDQLLVAGWEFDGATATFTFNDRFYRLYGTTAEREGGYTMSAERYAREFLLPGEERFVADALKDLETSSADEQQAEHRIRRRDGAVRYIVVRATAVRDAAGRLVGSRGANQDITERRALEEQLAQAMKMESVGRLAGGIAHDFNNLLGAILGHVDLALKDVTPAQPMHESLVEIRAAASRSADLTRQLLAFARQQTVAPRSLDVNDTVEKSLAVLRQVLGESIELVWRPGRHRRWVRMDPAQMGQVLTSLFMNARDAIADAGVVTIETDDYSLDQVRASARLGTAPGDYVRLSVTDNGCGMDKATQAQLFEPFFSTKAVGKGTGLGLATVYGVVRQNHGFIDVFSEPGVGTTLTIFLPSHVPEPGPAPAPAAPPAGRAGDTTTATLLLVEDDVPLLKLTRRILVAAGYQVIATSSPLEALRLAAGAGRPIDLLVTDVVMPDLNGRDLATQLTARFPSMKQLFTSGFTADVIARHGVLNDGLHFIQKPFSPDSLLDKVREVLNRR